MHVRSWTELWKTGLHPGINNNLLTVHYFLGGWTRRRFPTLFPASPLSPNVVCYWEDENRCFQTPRKDAGQRCRTSRSVSRLLSHSNIHPNSLVFETMSRWCHSGVTASCPEEWRLSRSASLPIRRCHFTSLKTRCRVQDSNCNLVRRSSLLD